MPKMKKMFYEFNQNNFSLNSIGYRMGNLEKPTYKFDTINGANHIAAQLIQRGGFAQQDRMIRDKRKSMDKACLYSYQAAWVKKYSSENEEFNNCMEPVRALINPNKLKLDYDDKVISVGFEHGFKTGDIFEWCNTNSYWLIYLQDLTELAYFRAEIRKCSYELSWLDEGEEKKTYIALRGPVETKIDYIQKHQISVDNPNYSINFMLPKTPETLKYFKRYSKFYLNGLAENQDNTCWRVEAIDTYSSPGIIEINAVEYYANEFEDKDGLVGALIAKPIDPNPETSDKFQIFGDTFIKPKKEYIYYVKNSSIGQWNFDRKLPIEFVQFIDKYGNDSIKIKWKATQSGQFDLIYELKDKEQISKKTIVIESLF